MQFLSQLKWLPFCQSGFQSCIPFCHEESFSFFGEENNIIPGRKLYLSRTWLLIIIWRFSSNSNWINLTASSLWMRRHIFLNNKTVWITDVTYRMLPSTFPFVTQIVDPSGGLLMAQFELFDSCLTVNLMINQACACSQWAFSMLSKPERSTSDLG